MEQLNPEWLGNKFRTSRKIGRTWRDSNEGDCVTADDLMNGYPLLTPLPLEDKGDSVLYGGFGGGRGGGCGDEPFLMKWIDMAGWSGDVSGDRPKAIDEPLLSLLIHSSRPNPLSIPVPSPWLGGVPFPRTTLAWDLAVTITGHQLLIFAKWATAVVFEMSYFVIVSHRRDVDYGTATYGHLTKFRFRNTMTCCWSPITLKNGTKDVWSETALDYSLCLATV